MAESVSGRSSTFRPILVRSDLLFAAGLLPRPVSATRALAHWEELGYPSEFVRVPWGQWMYHLNRGDLDLALRLADDLMGRCQERADLRGLILAHLCQGGTR